MANRRMFSKTVVNSGRFLRMPQTSRLLYYDLGMAADDDGIVEAFSVIRSTGATEDDLRVLAARDFVTILNDDLVAYINAWNENNYIRPDRYAPSIYGEMLVKIKGTVLKNDDGIPDGNQLTTNGIPSDNHCRPQVRLGKDRLSKGSIEGVQGEPAPKRKRFTPPTLDELQAYIRDQGYNVDAQRFLDHYEAVGWKVGKNPMKDWRAAVRTWNNREKPKQEKPQSDPRFANEPADVFSLYK